jgi:hypothetical protein
VLKAYKLHQDKNKSSDFITHQRLEWNITKWLRSWIDTDNDVE